MKQLVRDASLYVDTGDKVGIIGMSGTGKSTLLRILAQAEDPDSGTVQVFPNVRISYMSQNADMNEQATVLEQVFLGLSQEYREIAAYEARTMLNRLGITWKNVSRRKSWNSFGRKRQKRYKRQALSRRN